MTEVVKWTQIKANGGTQMRAELNQETVAEYADAMRGNDSYKPFPAVVVYFDGSDYWLADGFHRHAAAFQAFGSGCSIPAEVRAGTRRDAILHAAGANAAHGLRRTNADKRRAVEALLRDEEWVKWSDREIARRCNVSAPMVADVRRTVTVNYYSEEERTYTTKHGTAATMNTANIGKPQPTPADPPSREYHTAIIEPEPLRPATPPSRPLTDAEAESVVWRVLNRHADPGKAIMPKAAEMQRDWLIKADWGLFRGALADGVRFDHGQLLAMINRVKDELERKIAYFSVNFAAKPDPAPPVVGDEVGDEMGDEVGDAAKKEGDSDENYTPYYIIKAAREVLGKIDLDPASCKEAQDLVRATSWLGKATNSLQPKIPWLGRIWLNPPYSMTLPFVAKAFAEYDKGNIRAGIILTNNGTDTEWGQMLLSRCPVCFYGFNGDHGSRISFWQKSPDEPRRGNRHAQMISYLGPDVEKFAEVFSQFGVIKR